MPGRPKKLKIDAVRFIAHRDGESQTFTSRSKALTYLVGAKRNVRIEETYFVARGWELDVERYPLEGEFLRNETDYSGKRPVEREFVLKGADRVALEEAAERRRRASFIAHRFLLDDKMLRAQLSPESRKLAQQVLDDYFDLEADPQLDKSLEKAAEAKAKAELEAREAAIPTVWTCFEADLNRRVGNGLVQPNTADTSRYEAGAFRFEVPLGIGMIPFKDVRVSQVTDKMIRRWYDTFAATETRFGTLPSGKTLEHALNHLNGVRKALKRDSDHKQFASSFDVVDELLEEARKVVRDTDGWRRRLRLSNEAVLRVLECCKTDLERAAIALALAGGRPPSELVAAEWDHLEHDASGHLWWHVSASGIERKGEVSLRGRTKTKDVDYRQLSVCKGLAAWIEKRRGESNFILGIEKDKPLSPSTVIELIEGVLERAEVKRPGVSTYSFRHTVSDEVERILGRTARDLVLHGKRDRTTGGLHYSHAERDRRRKELTVDGKPYGEHMEWVSFKGFS